MRNIALISALLACASTGEVKEPADRPQQEDIVDLRQQCRRAMDETFSALSGFGNSCDLKRVDRLRGLTADMERVCGQVPELLRKPMDRERNRIKGDVRFVVDGCTVSEEP